MECVEVIDTIYLWVERDTDLFSEAGRDDSLLQVGLPVQVAGVEVADAQWVGGMQ